MKVTRREPGQLVLTAPAAALLTKGLAAAQARAKPDSKWAGVQVGMNVPYNYGTEWYGGGLRTVTVDEALEKTLQLGVSAIELRSQPVELFLGAPFGVLEPAREKPAEQAAA